MASAADKPRQKRRHRVGVGWGSGSYPWAWDWQGLEMLTRNVDPCVVGVHDEAEVTHRCRVKTPCGCRLNKLY